MKIYRNPDVLWREEDESRAEAMDGLTKGDDVAEVGTSVLFSDGLMVSLNILGTEVWKRCDGKSIDDIVSDLLEVFDVEPGVLKEDIKEFLSELAERDFIRYEDR